MSKYIVEIFNVMGDGSVIECDNYDKAVNTFINHQSGEIVAINLYNPEGDLVASWPK